MAGRLLGVVTPGVHDERRRTDEYDGHHDERNDRSGAHDPGLPSPADRQSSSTDRSIRRLASDRTDTYVGGNAPACDGVWPRCRSVSRVGVGSSHQHEDAEQRIRAARRGQSPSRDDAEVMELFRCYRRTRDPRVRNVLVERLGHIAVSAANRMRHRGEPQEDLEQVARYGLIKAVERFDPERGFAFSTFAYPTVMGELRRHFRDTGWALHVARSVKELSQELNAATEQLAQKLGRRPTVAELALETGVTEDQVLEAMDAGRAYRTNTLTSLSAEGAELERATSGRQLDAMLASTERLELAAHLQRLPRRQRRIMALRFFADRTQHEIAEEIGLSQVQVSRLIRAALAELRAAYEAGIDDDDDDDRGCRLSS